MSFATGAVSEALQLCLVHFALSIPASRHPKKADVKRRLVGGNRCTPGDFPSCVRGLAVSLLKKQNLLCSSGLAREVSVSLLFLNLEVLNPIISVHLS